MQLAPVIVSSNVINSGEPTLLRLDRGIYADAAIAPAISHSLSVIGAHGAGIVNGSFVGGVQDAIRALAGIRAEELAQIGEQMAGSLTVYIWDSIAGKATVLADPLGGGKVFLHRDSDDVAVSSHMGALVSLRHRQGKPLRKSLAHGLSTLVTGGAGGLESSSYQDVELIDQFQYVEVDQRGAHIRTYRTREGFCAKEFSYDEGLDRVEVEVRRNARIAGSASHERKISHLTGGLDSRIVLGALLKEGVSEEFAFNCMGKSDAPDKVVAHGLSTEFGLTMTEYTGLSAYHQPETFNERILAAMRYSAGMHMTPAHAHMRRSQAMVLSGGYSGFYRSNYRRNERPVEDDDARVLAEGEWGGVGFSLDNGKRLISEQLMERYVQTVANFVHDLKGAALPIDLWQDYYKMRRRTRFYVGEISQQWSPFASRFDPLYSVSAGQAMLGHSWDVRKSGVFVFDLMARLGQDLIQLPFDSNRFNDVYHRIRSEPPSKSFTGKGGPRYNDWRQPKADNLSSVHWPKPTAKQSALAKKLRAPVQQVVELDRVRTETRAMIASLSGDDRRQAFNPEGMQLLYGRAERHGWSLRSLFVIHSGLLWYTDTEPPSAAPAS